MSKLVSFDVNVVEKFFKEKLEQAGLNSIFGKSKIIEGLQNSVISLHAQLIKIVHSKKKPVINVEDVKAEF